MLRSLHKKQTTFFCFSPPVMIATFLIEIALAVYTIWKYKPSLFTRLAIMLLVFLAFFQFAEFFICTGDSMPLQWSRLSFVAITFLPPLGIHAILTLSKQAKSPLVYIAYATGGAFMTYFALSAQSLTGNECLGNYVTFQVNQDITWLYALYYYGWVVISMLLAYYFGKRTANKQTKQALFGLSAGNALLLIPTTSANLIDSSTMSGIPSIMCGFAVIFALILGFYVLPRAARKRS